MEAKARKEKMEMQRQTEKNHETLAVLQQQMKELDEKKREEKQLLDEQAQILVSSNSLIFRNNSPFIQGQGHGMNRGFEAPLASRATPDTCTKLSRFLWITPILSPNRLSHQLV